MGETCYSNGTKIILASHQKENGAWVCHFSIPELKKSQVIKYQGHVRGEYQSEQEAKVAAFTYSKKLLGSSK